MKKGKNLTLLIGICCILSVIVWQIALFVFNYFAFPNAYNFKSLILSPMAIIFLLLIVPTVLLVRNLQNKTGKALAIISVVMNIVCPLWLFFNSLNVNVPQYLIYNELGIANVYLTLFVGFLKNGGLLYIIGYMLIIIGSFLSLPSKKSR